MTNVPAKTSFLREHTEVLYAQELEEVRKQDKPSVPTSLRPF